MRRLRWSELWYRPRPTGRSVVLWKALLAIVALDTWRIVLTSRSAHGAADFNVAHFGWLDGLPVSPGIHSGALFIAGFVAAAMFWGGASRLGFAALCAAYSHGWAMSRLDSYQHHYFLSLVLLCGALTRHDEIRRRERSEQWPYALLLATTAIMYLFTAIAKLEPAWLSGATLRVVLDSAPLRLPGSAAVDALLAIAIVVVELVIALGYALAVAARGLGGDTPHRGLRFIGVAFAAALTLHAGIALMDLRIGLFSLYMIAIAFAALAPERWLAVAAARLARIDRAPERGPSDGRVSILVAVIASLLLVVTAQMISLDVPGATPAAGLVACGVVGASLRWPKRVAFGASCALASWWLAILLGPAEAALTSLGGWLGG